MGIITDVGININYATIKKKKKKSPHKYEN